MADVEDSCLLSPLKRESPAEGGRGSVRTILSLADCMGTALASERIVLTEPSRLRRALPFKGESKHESSTSAIRLLAFFLTQFESHTENNL